MAEAIAYHWSAREPIAPEWRAEIARYVERIPGITLKAREGSDPEIRIGDGVHAPVEFTFPRRRGGGTVSLASGAKLILVSLGVAALLKLELADPQGEAFDPGDPRSWLARIPFAETAREIETLAEAVHFLPARVWLEELAAARVKAGHGSVFF